ncbi:MAG: butyrate kinase [candidate division Zixibacteria bacterium]|nr:butyrate kinase [candidate division Zixibacteria bacterium]
MTAGDLRILVINPGSTSTKVAVFYGREEVHRQTIEHPADDLARFAHVAEQFDLRLQGIEAWLESLPAADLAFDAIAGRGAPLKPLEGGTYIITETMLNDIRTSKYSNHASNLGALLADHFARTYRIPAYITDPITVDNFPDIARVSGVPGIARKCRSHVLNIKAVGWTEATKLGKKLTDVNFIVAHMGGGISIAALAGGLIVEVNDALLGMGPFSPERAGALPIGALVDLCYSGTYTREEMIALLSYKSGLAGYLGEGDLRKVEEKIVNGDQKAAIIYEAMCYQIAKEIGAAAAALKGRVDGIILTGGMANSKRLTDTVTEYVRFIAPVAVIPGEHEMKSLAEGAIRALTGVETAKVYA